MREIDLVVIGGGSAGTAAALHARAHGLSAVLVESDERSTHRVAEDALADLLSLRPLSRAPRQRVEEGFQRAVRRAGEVAAAASDRRDRLLARTDVARLTGRARLTGERGAVEVTSAHAMEHLRARWVLLATGSRRSVLPGGATDARGALLDAAEPQIGRASCRERV